MSVGGGGSGGGGATQSRDEIISTVAIEIAAKVPANYDMEFAQLKYPVLWEQSMNTVLCQELIRFNNLLSVMRESLVNIQKAVKGLVVMSSELEVLGTALSVNRNPIMWKNRSYPSLKPLSGYIADQQLRLAFFTGWLMGEQLPSVFWISGFFFTQAFLTGAAQNFARRYTIPIDDVIFDFEMMSEDHYDKGPDNGVYTYGLFLEGNKHKHIHPLQHPFDHFLHHTIYLPSTPNTPSSISPCINNASSTTTVCFSRCSMGKDFTRGSRASRISPQSIILPSTHHALDAISQSRCSHLSPL